MKVRISPIEARYAQAAFDLVSDVFVRHSSLHRCLGIGLEEYRAYLRPAFDQMIAEGLSVVAVDVDTDEVLGCILATDMAGQGPSCSERAPFASLAAISQEMFAQYCQHRPVVPGQSVLVDMAAVADRATGAGIYGQMRRAVESKARAAGFRYVVGELSSATTQHVIVTKRAHRVVGKVVFDEFEVKGVAPFRQITNPPALLLTEADLSD